MMYHVKTSIKGLLSLPDEELGYILNMDGKAVREELEARLSQGELYIPATGCVGFDPVKGCPGHQSEIEGGKSNE